MVTCAATSFLLSVYANDTHTLAGGRRGFDILHAAGALVLGADRFLTFDRDQKRLVGPEGLAGSDLTPGRS